MATARVTFTLDRISIDRLNNTAEQLKVSKREVIREAIMEFHNRLGRLSDRERLAMLRAFDELVPRIPPRSKAAVERELAELRRARKTGGRRTAMASE